MTLDQVEHIKMDYVDPANSINMPEMADMTLAMDFLIRAKEGVRNISIALTETVSPDVRAHLRTQLHQAITMHQEITDLMVRKKWFHPYELEEQYQLDQLSAGNTLEIAQLKLFPDDTTRKGMFDRMPDKHVGGNKA